ncbi:hypothetical protein EfmAA242_32280 (plasmid) [Enterococcus faecium]|nr:hypothetical protein EfmAA242_32280 [Enterococcus faecium]
MNNYSVMIKNSAKADLKKIKQSNLKPQFEKVIQTLKEDPYLPTQSFEKLKPRLFQYCYVERMKTFMNS